MKTWDKEKVLWWIQQREPNLLADDNVNKFKKANFTGSAFLLSNIGLFEHSGVSLGDSIALNGLVDEVKSKFIPLM